MNEEDLFANFMSEYKKIAGRKFVTICSKIL